MEGYDPEVLVTQTQPFAVSQPAPSPPVQPPGVHARLLSLVVPGWCYELKEGQNEVVIGRHPDCQILVENKLASARHLRIYCDKARRYFLEELSSNGCYLNEQHLKQGETRALRHGDEFSLCMPARGAAQKPFAAYILRVADHDSNPGSVRAVGSQASVAGQDSVVSKPGDGKHDGLADKCSAGGTAGSLVSEQWVHDHWDTRNVLGSGNFSEVRLGVSVKDGQRRAIKVIDKKKSMSWNTKRESHLSLSSEAEVLASLAHPAIVKVFQTFETQMHLYLVMELLEGGDLLQYILEHGAFSEGRARVLFAEVAGGVKYLHQHNIVHRDLKPENILLTSKEDPASFHLKIADFGLARKNMKSKDCRTFCGTPHYFAPEVITTFQGRAETGGEAKGYDRQADMWSLGVILYIMLSGIPPFEDEGLYEQILEGRYEFDVREWTSVSDEGKDLVSRLMKVNPKERLTIIQTSEHPWLKVGVPPAASPPEEEPPLKRQRTDQALPPVLGVAAARVGA